MEEVGVSLHMLAKSVVPEELHKVKEEVVVVMDGHSVLGEVVVEMIGL